MGGVLTNPVSRLLDEFNLVAVGRIDEDEETAGLLHNARIIRNFCSTASWSLAETAPSFR